MPAPLQIHMAANALSLAHPIFMAYSFIYLFTRVPTCRSVLYLWSLA